MMNWWALLLLKTAAVFSLILNVVAQLVGLLATNPSLITIHYRHLSFFSPSLTWIAILYTLQVLCQLLYLHQFVTTPSSPPSARAVLLADYAPMLILYNLMTGAWAPAWETDHLAIAAAPLAVAALSQVAYVTGLCGSLGAMNVRFRASVAVHLAAKSSAALGIMDVLHTLAAGMAPGQQIPDSPTKIVIGVGVVATAFVADWVFGAAVVLDLLALSAGQGRRDPHWAKLLLQLAAATTVLVGIRNWRRPQYVNKYDAYEGLAREEPEETSRV